MWSDKFTNNAKVTTTLDWEAGSLYSALEVSREDQGPINQETESQSPYESPLITMALTLPTEPDPIFSGAVSAQLPLVIHCFVNKLFLITFLSLSFYPELVVIGDIDKIILKQMEAEMSFSEYGSLVSSK